MPKIIAILLAILLASLLIFKSYERDRILDWFEGLSDFNKALLGSAAVTLLTIAFTWLTAPWIQAALMRWF